MLVDPGSTTALAAALAGLLSDPDRRKSLGDAGQIEPDTARLHDPANKLVPVPVRSGQLIYAERGDLIVVGSVASGAELIASGNIHVYGRMRGRAMAGVDGNENARIFCQNLDAELLAIAGLYRTNEHLEEHLRRKAVQVFLRDQNLCVEALG